MAEDRVGSIVEPSSVWVDELNEILESPEQSKSKLQRLVELMSGAYREAYVDGLIGALARSNTPVTDPQESGRKAKAFFKQRPRPWRWHGSR